MEANLCSCNNNLMISPAVYDWIQKLQQKTHDANKVIAPREQNMAHFVKSDGFLDVQLHTGCSKSSTCGYGCLFKTKFIE